MDLHLMPAAIVLIFTNVIFALLAELKRREIHRKDSQLIQLASKLSQARQEGYNDGLITGLKRGYGEMYQAVVKAHGDGRDPVAAASRVGHMNAEFLLTEQDRIMR